MAALANGVAVVSNTGQLSEHVWARSAGIMLSASPAVDEIIQLATGLLGDPVRLQALSAGARHFYLENFHLAKTLAALTLCTEAAPEVEPACAMEKA
jgi:hypothetical protein